MQLNEALFTSTEGYVLKPASLRHSRKTTYINQFHPTTNSPKKRRLRVHVAGATAIPIPSTRPQSGTDIKPYLTASLIHPTRQSPIKQKTSPYKQHKLGPTHLSHKRSNPPNTDPLWDETLEWQYDDDDDNEGNELVFLRMLIKSDDAFAANPKLAASAVRLLYVVKGEWVFVRMLGLRGEETGCSVLLRFDVDLVP